MRTEKHKAAAEEMAGRTGRVSAGKRRKPKGKGKRGKRTSRVSRKRTVLRSSSGATGSEDPWPVDDADCPDSVADDDAGEYDDADEALDEPDTWKPRKTKPCRAKAKAKAASPKPKAKAKAKGKPKAKAKAKASMKKKAEKSKPKAKAKPTKAKGKNKAASSEPTKKDGKGVKRRSRSAKDRFQLEAHCRQEKVWLGSRWIFQILPDQQLGCPSCRFIYNGCSSCEKPGFRGMSAAKMREDPDYVEAASYVTEAVEEAWDAE